MFKKFLALFVILSLLVLCACGTESANTVAPKEEATVATLVEDAVAPETEDSSSDRDDLAIATECIGKELKVLIDQIGEPQNSSYASSCIGDGEDGELYYEGFTVYTYKDTNGTETIEDVL